MAGHESQLEYDSARKSNLDECSPGGSFMHRRAHSMNKSRGSNFGLDRDYDSLEY